MPARRNDRVVGVTAQIRDVATGQVVAVSTSAMRCLVIHQAPLDKSCEKLPHPTVATCGATILDEPVGWKVPGFATSAWPNATVYSEADVGPKDGYFTITWDAAAKLIWTADLKADNTLLCRLTVPGPSVLLGLRCRSGLG